MLVLVFLINLYYICESQFDFLIVNAYKSLVSLGCLVTLDFLFLLMQATLLLQNTGLPGQTSETNFLFSAVLSMNGSLIQFPHVALDPVYIRCMTL